MKQRIRNLPITRLALGGIKSWKWLTYYLRHSGTLRRSFDPTVNRAKIMKEAHTIEKGLSFKNIRPFFGADKRAHLLSEMRKAERANANEMPRAIGVSVLDRYVSWHNDQGLSNGEVQLMEKELNELALTRGIGGTVPYRPDYSSDETAAYEKVVTSRRSVRNFVSKPVSLDVLKEAIQIANYSPSVCNRHAWAASIVQEKDSVRKLLALQNGNRGFEDGIHNVIVILADVRGFLDEYEMFEPFVDAGIFSAAVVNALNARNIASCCLNLCVSHHKAIEVANALDLQEGLFPVMMIACGYASDGCQVAMSTRLEPSIFVS